MLTIKHQKHVMGDHFICFFEILDGVFQGISMLPPLVSMKYPRKLVLMQSLILD